jgi:hypothetical protein
LIGRFGVSDGEFGGLLAKSARKKKGKSVLETNLDLKKKIDAGLYALVKQMLENGKGNKDDITDYAKQAYGKLLGEKSFEKAIALAEKLLDGEHASAASKMKYEWECKHGKYADAARTALSQIARCSQAGEQEGSESRKQWETDAFLAIRGNIEANRGHKIKNRYPAAFCDVRLFFVPKNILDMLISDYEREGRLEEVLKIAVLGKIDDKIAKAAEKLCEKQAEEKSYVAAFTTARNHLEGSPVEFEAAKKAYWAMLLGRIVINAKTKKLLKAYFPESAPENPFEND